MPFISSLILKVEAGPNHIQTIAEDAISLRDKFGMMIEIIFDRGTILVNEITTVDEIIQEFMEL